MPNAENLKGKGFESRPENINRKGRKPSIKTAIKKLLVKKGELKIKKDRLIDETEKFYIFEIPTQNTLALKIVDLAMSNNKDSFNAMKLLLETFDGKAIQKVDAKVEAGKPKVVFENHSKEFPNGI